MMEQVCVNLVASNLPVSFWAYAAQHAVDVLKGRIGVEEISVISMLRSPAMGPSSFTFQSTISCLVKEW